jgi:hypothetical protein
MYRSVGSSSRVPARPFAAEVSTWPLKLRLRAPDTSTNPPSPDMAPPFAAIAAEKRVSPSAHTKTRPPLPSAPLSALSLAPAATLVCDEF